MSTDKELVRMTTDPLSGTGIAVRGGALVFVAGGQTVAYLTSPAGRLIAGYQDEQPIQLKVTSVDLEDLATLVYDDDRWAVIDQVQRIKPGLFRCARIWRNASSQPQNAVLCCELEHPGRDLFYLIPAVSYNGNAWGSGQEPKGLYDGAGESCPWLFGGDRASVPACTISEGDGYAVALFAGPEEARQSACGFAPGTQGLIHRLCWPLQEQPRSYAKRDRYAPGISSTVCLAAGESCARTFLIAITPVSESHQGYCAVLDNAWSEFYRRVPARYTPQQIWNLAVRFAKERLWVEDEQFIGFSIGLTLRDGQWVQHPEWRYEIGWCGQNAGLAAMLLQDYLWHGYQDSWRRGAAALDFWAAHGRFDNGLFYTHFEHKLAGIENPDLDTCNLGHGAYFYLLASELAEKANQPHPLWRQMGLSVCDFFSRHALANGKLGRVWKAEGQLKDADGTSGCSLVWALAKAFRMTGTRDYLRTAEQAFRAYAEDDLAALRCTAGALDTDCIDKETAFSLLISGLDLFEITGNAYYRRQAEKAGYYLASWQWHYNLTYPAGTPATEMGYETFGGTSVSVQHHHLDPWGALIALGWLRLGRATGRAIWSERGAAAWRQATLGISDGTLSLKGIARPAGGQDEGFYHTRWGGQPGNVSDWLVAWPSAFRLITLQHWPHWDELRK